MLRQRAYGELLPTRREVLWYGRRVLQCSGRRDLLRGHPLLSIWDHLLPAGCRSRATKLLSRGADVLWRDLLPQRLRRHRSGVQDAVSRRGGALRHHLLPVRHAMCERELRVPFRPDIVRHDLLLERLRRQRAALCM